MIVLGFTSIVDGVGGSSQAEVDGADSGVFVHLVCACSVSRCWEGSTCLEGEGLISCTGRGGSV